MIMYKRKAHLMKIMMEDNDEAQGHKKNMHNRQRKTMKT